MRVWACPSKRAEFIGSIFLKSAVEAAQRKDAELSAQIRPFQDEINQLGRQFWVTKKQIRSNKNDLSASRYRHIEQDEAYYEKPNVTMERLLKLEQVMVREIKEVEESLK